MTVLATCTSLNPTFETHLRQRPDSTWAVWPVSCKCQYCCRYLFSLFGVHNAGRWPRLRNPSQFMAHPCVKGTHNAQAFCEPTPSHTTHRVSSTFTTMLQVVYNYWCLVYLLVFGQKSTRQFVKNNLFLLSNNALLELYVISSAFVSKRHHLL